MNTQAFILGFLKEARKKYRPRAEVWAGRNGEIFGGFYPDGSFGVYGGGVDPGETPEEAGAREYAEEAGRKVKNLERLPIRPVRQDWHNKNVKRPEYDGSKTYLLTGDLTNKRVKATEPFTRLKDVGFHPISEAIEAIQQKLDDQNVVRGGDWGPILRARLKALKMLQARG